MRKKGLVGAAVFLQLDKFHRSPMGGGDPKRGEQSRFHGGHERGGKNFSESK